MTSERVLQLLEDLAAQFPVIVSKERVLGLIASIATNRLTDHQIVTAVNRCRDELRFFPLAVEFLERAIEKQPDSDVVGHGVFDSLRLNSSCRFGYVDPVNGTQWERAKVALAFGEVCAKAFDSVGGNAFFKAMNERSEPYDRIAFIKAYRAASAADVRRKQLSGGPTVFEIESRAKAIGGDSR